MLVKGKTIADELAPHEVDSLLGLLLLQLLLSVLSNEEALEAIKVEDELDLLVLKIGELIGCTFAGESTLMLTAFVKFC